MMSKDSIIGIIGSGAMGAGIAQVAAMAGHKVIVYDTSANALEKAADGLAKMINKLEEKGKIESADKVLSLLSYAGAIDGLSTCGLVIEAIVENLDVKKKVFASLENVVLPECILASNTSSLSITSIAAACKFPERVIGLHFFNPAPLMALVEVIPAIQTKAGLADECKAWMTAWGKTAVLAKDTPGFIVNRVARPFYGEALRIFEEGIADMATIDWAMTEIGGFRMGPFALMDYIGHDVNFVVTETVWKAFFYDGRYKPSFAQQRLLEAGWLGRKSGKGFYDYSENAMQPEAKKDVQIGKGIVERIVVMLINEAADALHYNVASPEDLELAMTKGVNYPKGLLAWADEMGTAKVLGMLDSLYDLYHEERYRASLTLRMAVAKGMKVLGGLN